MRIKTLICNCKGLSPSFKSVDMNALPFEVETDLGVDYAVVNPELCGEQGGKVMEDVLRSAEDDPDTIVVVAACEAETQQKLFKEVLRNTGFDQDHFVPVDIRHATNEGIIGRLREKIEELVHSEKEQD